MSAIIYPSHKGETKHAWLKLPETPTNWVRLPKQLGGRKVNVVDEFIATSCKCGNHPSKILILDCDYMCVECSKNPGFMWMNKPTDIEKFKTTMTTKAE